MHWRDYDPEDFYDELFLAKGQAREEARGLVERLGALPTGELLQRQQAARDLLMRLGVTFNVYGDTEGTERIIPFDVIPRILPASEWTRLERGLAQRITALNLFLADIYGDRQCPRDGHR